MSCLELEQLLAEVIRLEADIIDELFCLLSQHMGDDIARIPCMEKISRVCEIRHRLGLDDNGDAQCNT